MTHVYQKTYFGFVYLWFDRKRKKYCVGSHLGSLKDGYTSSTGHMAAAYRKRKNDFRRKILYLHPNDDLLELRKVEARWLLLIKPEELGHRYYNRQRHISPQNRPSEGKRERTSKSLKIYYRTHAPAYVFPKGDSNPGFKKGQALAICATTGNTIGLVSSDDPRWLSGEIVGNRKGKKVPYQERPNIAVAMRGSNNPMFGKADAAEHLNRKTHTCSRCGILTTKGNWVRWHEDKCRRI